MQDFGPKMGMGVGVYLTRYGITMPVLVHVQVKVRKNMLHNTPT